MLHHIAHPPERRGRRRGLGLPLEEPGYCAHGLLKNGGQSRAARRSNRRPASVEAMQSLSQFELQKLGVTTENFMAGFLLHSKCGKALRKCKYPPAPINPGVRR
jgi:hypothetical protein